MFEFSLLSPAKEEERPASSCQSAIFGNIFRNSRNLAGTTLHNSVHACSLFARKFSWFSSAFVIRGHWKIGITRKLYEGASAALQRIGLCMDISVIRPSVNQLSEPGLQFPVSHFISP